MIAEISVKGAAEAKSQLAGVGQESEKTTGGFKNMLSTAAGFAVFNLAAGAFGFLKDQLGAVFEESMNAQAGLAQTNQVIASTHGVAGVTANAVLDLATQYSHLTEFSDDTVQASENMLLTFTNIGKNVFPMATKTVLDMSQALGQDTKSSAIQLGKALNDPVAGITALQRVGVTFTQTQKDQIKNFMATNNIAGAQGIILKELQKEFGGSAEAAGKTFGGQLAIARQRLDDIRQTIGDALMPILAGLLQRIGPIVDAFSSWMASGHALSDVLHFLSANSQILIPIAAGLGAVILTILVPAVLSLAAGVIAATWPFLLVGAAVAGLAAIFMHFYQTNAGFKAFIDGFVSGLRQAWSVIQANFIPVLQQLVAFFQTQVLPAIGRFGDFLTNNVLPVIQQFGNFIQQYILPALQALGSFLVSTFAPVWQQLVQVWNGQILPALKQLWAAIQPLMPLFKMIGAVILGVVVIAFGLLVGVLAGVVKAIAGFITGLATVIGGIVQIFSGMIGIVSGVVAFIKDLLTGNFSALGNDLHTIWNGIVTMFSGVWNVIKGIFQAAWGAISGLVSGFVQAVIGFFQHLASALVGHSIVPDMINGIISFFAGLPGRVLGFVAGMVSGVIGFFGNMAGQAIGRISSMVGSVIGLFGSLVSQAIGRAASMVGGVIGALAALPGQAGGVISSMAGTVLGRLYSLAGSALSAGASIVGNIAQGIRNGIGAVANAIGSVVNFIASHLPHSPAKEGPLRDLEYMGTQIPAQLATGMKKNIPAISASLTTMLSPLVSMPTMTPSPIFSGGGSIPPAAPVHVNVYLDGAPVAKKLMPHIVQQIRTATGVKF